MDDKPVCPSRGYCVLFTDVDLLQILRHNIELYYCKRNYEKCARHKLFVKGQNVPLTLLPHDKILVEINK